MDEKGFDTINVVPFIDIMLVLLAIVLTTSTFIVTGVIPVELPRASTHQDDFLRTQSITVDRQGRLFLNGAAISWAGLRQEAAKIRRETPILIAADRDIALQLFVDVMDTLKSLGFKRVSLRTETLR